MIKVIIRKIHTKITVRFYFSEDAVIIPTRQRMTRRKGKLCIVLLQMQHRAAIAEHRAADPMN